jgi:multidrug transporter EmrE-like cation transporter
MLGMLDYTAILYGTAMALIDVGMIGLVKEISRSTVKYLGLMIIPTIAYAIQPWIFLSALRTETMTVMNLMWDLLSDVLVAIVGILYFGEKIGPVRMVGLTLAFISLCLLSWKED